MNIISRFEHFAGAHPNKPAFIFSRNGRWQTVTYHQLADSTERFVFGLLDSGLTSGMTAALLTPPSVDFFALAFALLKVGVVPIILDPAIGMKKVGECLAEARPDIFIGNRLTHALRILFGWGKDSVKHNLTIRSVKVQSRRPPERASGRSERVEGSKGASQPLSSTVHCPPSALAAIIYTSGSTGIPKGVVYTHANFAAQLDMLVETFNISPDEIDLPAFPLYALIDVLIGVTSVIPDIRFPIPRKTDPQKVIAAIQKFNVTNMFASPVVLDILSKFWSAGACYHNFQQQAVGLQSLKRVITAGAPATIELQEDFRKLLNDKTDLFGIYGATEVLPIAKVESREIFELKGKSAKGAGVCLGRPVGGARVRVIKISESAIQRWDESLEVPPNIVGEITVQGAAVTESYIERKEANLSSKIHNGDQIIHRMGDVGYFDEQGRLWYCGRKSHRVTMNDDVMYTEQIEGVFNVHPLVYRSALVGVDNEPVLWVELAKKANKEKIKHELMELAKDHLQASKIKTFLFMKKFPTDIRHNSKIIREQLTLLAEKRLK